MEIQLQYLIFLKENSNKLEVITNILFSENH